MTRRLASFLVAVAILIPCLTVTAYAEEIYNPWTDLLDIATVNDSGTNYFAFNDSTTVTIDAGYESIVSYIDMVWYCGYGAPNSIELWRNTNPERCLALTIEQLGTSNFYRIYGSVGGYTMSEFKFDIDATGGTNSYRSYEIRSCRIAGSLATYTVDVYYHVEPTPSAKYTKNAVFEPIVDLEYGVTVNYYMEITPLDWSKYDYLDLVIFTQCASISSIHVEHSGRALPYTVSDFLTVHNTETNQDLYDTPLQPDQYVMLHIDLTTLNHASTVAPRIVITGAYNNGQWATIGYDSCIGYIKDADRDGPLYWFNRATEFLTGLFGQDSDKADQFQEDAAQQGSEMDALNDQLQEVTKPPVEDIQTDVGDYVDSQELSIVTETLSEFTGDSLITSMFMVVLIIALVAYVLFGKR